MGSSRVKYWANDVLGLHELIEDGFYDPGNSFRKAGEEFPALQRGLKSKLEGRETILVDEGKDGELASFLAHLRQEVLGRRSAGEVLRMLSEEVAARMGGSDPKIARKTSRHLKTLKKDQGHKIIMIGDIRFGVCRHRCLLFKVCCERVTSVRCTLERPSNGRDLLHGTHAWNVVEIPRSSGPVRAVCDLMEAPGLLLDASHHRTLVQDWHEYGLFGGELPEDAFVNKEGLRQNVQEKKLAFPNPNRPPPLSYTPKDYPKLCLAGAAGGDFPLLLGLTSPTRSPKSPTGKLPNGFSDRPGSAPSARRSPTDHKPASPLPSPSGGGQRGDQAEEGSSQVVEARNKQSREAYQDRAAALLEKMPEGLRSSLANVLHPDGRRGKSPPPSPSDGQVDRVSGTSAAEALTVPAELGGAAIPEGTQTASPARSIPGRPTTSPARTQRNAAKTRQGSRGVAAPDRKRAVGSDKERTRRSSPSKECEGMRATPRIPSPVNLSARRDTAELRDRLESEAPEVMLDGAQGAEGEDGLREEAPPQAGLHMAAKQAGQEEVEEEEKEEEVQETQEVLKTQAQREKHASMRRAREELEQRRIELAQQCERRAHEADAEARQSWLQVVMKAEDGWFMNAPDPPSIAPEAKVDAEQERQWRAWDEGLAKKEADTVASSRRWAQAVMHTLDYMEKPYRKAEWGFDEDAYMEMAEETPEVAEVAEVAEVPEVSDVNEPVAAICASPFVSQETLRRASLEARPPEATASEMRKPMPGLKLDIPSPSGGSPTSSPAPSSSTAAAGALAASRGTQLVAPRPPSPQCSARTSSAPAGDVAAKSKPPGRLAMMLKKKGAINRAWPSLGKVLQKSQGSEGGKNPMSNLQQLVRDALLAKTAADSEPRELKLSGDLLTGNALNELTKRVAMQATLETLELRSNGLTMAAGPHAPMSRLCGALQAALVLRRLVIVDNNLQDSGTAAVCRALTNNTTLEHLVLSSCNLNGEAVGALVPLLKLGHSRLSHLDLSQNRLCGAGFAALGKALPYASSLRKLTLAGNAVGVEGMRGLAVGLAQNTTITTLNLDDCSLYGCAEDRKEDPGVVWELGGIEALAATVGDHPSLTALHLAGNNLGGLRVLEGISVDDVMGGQGRVGETVEYQAEAWSVMRQWVEPGDDTKAVLTKLQLGRAEQAPAVALMHALQRAPRLQELHLERNDLGGVAFSEGGGLFPTAPCRRRGQAALVAALQYARPLRRLYLAGNQLDCRWVEGSLAAALQGRSAADGLQVLDMRGCHLDHPALLALLNAVSCGAFRLPPSFGRCSPPLRPPHLAFVLSAPPPRIYPHGRGCLVSKGSKAAQAKVRKEQRVPVADLP
ncbi:hypothetical protein CYMTET_51974, partial [Cymbomonas tetramitiformis]